MTNFERIKNMSVWQLSLFINAPTSCNDICDDECVGCAYSCKHRNGIDVIYEWLNSESEVE